MDEDGDADVDDGYRDGIDGGTEVARRSDHKDWDFWAILTMAREVAD
jgi:hypothetical protein